MELSGRRDASSSVDKKLALTDRDATEDRMDGG